MCAAMHGALLCPQCCVNSRTAIHTLQEKKDKTEKKEKKRKAEEAAADAPAAAEDKAARKAKKKAAGETAGAAAAAAADAAAPAAAAPAAAADPLALDNFALSEPVKSLLRAKGIEALFPIQAKCLEPALAGRDVVGRARTGCGKTLAFVLPIVERLSQTEGGGRRPFGRAPSVVVLAPTRELAKQVRFAALAPLCSAVQAQQRGRGAAAGCTSAACPFQFIEWNQSVNSSSVCSLPQVAADFEYYAKAFNLSTVVLYGGTQYGPQVRAQYPKQRGSRAAVVRSPVPPAA